MGATIGALGAGVHARLESLREMVVFCASPTDRVLINFKIEQKAKHVESLGASKHVVEGLVKTKGVVDDPLCRSPMC